MMAEGDETRPPLRPESLMMGFAHDPATARGSIRVPIYQTSTFEFESAEAGKQSFQAFAAGESGEDPTFIYSRLDNPNLAVAEERLRQWDRADRALLFASGMTAISTTLLAYLRPGDSVLHTHPLYGCTDFVVKRFLAEFDVMAVPVEPGMDRGAVEERLSREAAGRPLGLVLIETPANPTLDLFDIEMLAAVAAEQPGRSGPAPVVVDNTFLGPMWQRPLEHGADLVVYSATKYIGGHSDLVAGAVVGGADRVAPVALLRAELGTMAAPWTAWLITRSLETLRVRTDRQQETARRIAEFLVEHPKARNVRHLDFLEPGDPQHEIFKRQCLGAGAMLTFEVDGGEPAAFRCLDALRVIRLAVSLGSTESLAEHPATMTHSGVDPADKELLGIGPGLIRLSVGVEAADDLIADLAGALRAV